MIRLLVSCVFVAVTSGFHMPGPTYRPPINRHDNWSPHDVYFPGPTNQNYYYPSKFPPSIPAHLIPTEPPRVSPTPYQPSTEPAKVSTPINVSTTVADKVISTTKPAKVSPATEKVNDIGADDVCNATVEPPDPDSQCCGVEASGSNYIVGGNATRLEQYPWLVLIEYYNARERRHKRLCGGFLISGRYVLTAAHCLVGEVLEIGTPVNIILGDYNATNEGPDCLPPRVGVRPCTEGAIKVPIEAAVVHPKHYHDNNVSYNDIALVKMSKTVDYTDFIRPVCLPRSDITVAPPADLRLYTAGWGAIKQRLVFQMGQKMFAGEYDNVKRHVDLPLRPEEECREKLGNFIGPGHMCAGGERGKDSCRGDSGGPLMHENDGIFEAIGIVSAGSGKKPCGTEGFPALYTKVFTYLDWIKENTKA